MLDLALSETYTRVFTCGTMDNAWVGDSRPFISFSLACFYTFRDVPHSRVSMLDLALS